MDGQSGIIETGGDVIEDDNQAEQDDGKSSDERPEGLPFSLFNI